MTISTTFSCIKLTTNVFFQTTPAFNFTSTTSTYEDDDNPKDDNTKDDKDDDNSEEAWPVTTHPPAIVRTLSPSTR